MLKSDYKDDMTLKEAKSLAIKVLSKTMDGTALSSEKRTLFWWLQLTVTIVEFAVISLVNGKVSFQPFSDEAVDALLKEEAAAAEATKETK